MCNEQKSSQVSAGEFGRVDSASAHLSSWPGSGLGHSWQWSSSTLNLTISQLSQHTMELCRRPAHNDIRLPASLMENMQSNFAYAEAHGCQHSFNSMHTLNYPPPAALASILALESRPIPRFQPLLCLQKQTPDWRSRPFWSPH